MNGIDSVADISEALAENLKGLRHSRGLTQMALAKAAGVPRATLATLETGAANPTLSVLVLVARALRVPLEELLEKRRGDVTLTRRDDLVVASKAKGVQLRALLPDSVPGALFERMELEGMASVVGSPHAAGTREYAACERGVVDLYVAGEAYRLRAGDVLSFRGDQKHSYRNGGAARAVVYSVIILDM